MPLTDKQKFDALDLMDGQTSDREIARILGVKSSAVGRYRRSKGIAGIQYLPPMFEPTEEQLAELEHCSDREMEKRYGVNNATWRRVRKRYGIANFRPPTTIKGEPNTWAEKPERKPFKVFETIPTSRLPARDHSVAGEAQSFLQRAGWHCFARFKIGLGSGWQVGRNVMNQNDMIAFAEKKGFERKEWMGA